MCDLTISLRVVDTYAEAAWVNVVRMRDERAGTRRRFCELWIYSLWTAIASALGAPAAAYLLAPPRATRESDWVEAGKLAQLETGVPEQLVFRRNRVDGWKVASEKASAWVVKKGNNEVVAFAPQCTHLGCGYNWDDQEQRFLCPCHWSTFSIDGEVLSGPAPRPLDRYLVKVESDKLFLGPVQKPERET